MKMNKACSLLLVGVIGSLLTTSRTWAQDATEKIPTPRPPYVAPVPDSGHWVVTLKRIIPDAPTATPDGKPAPPVTLPPGTPRSIDMLKANDTRIITVSFDDGSKKRVVQQGVYVLVPSSRGPQLMIPNGDTKPYALYDPGFLLADGVSRDTFKEFVKYNGVPCFHYRQEATSAKPSVDAWIAVDSMLPVATLSEGIEADFQFLNTPVDAQLTPEEEAIITRQQQQVKAFQAVR